MRMVLVSTYNKKGRLLSEQFTLKPVRFGSYGELNELTIDDTKFNFRYENIDDIDWEQLKAYGEEAVYDHEVKGLWELIDQVEGILSRRKQ